MPEIHVEEYSSPIKTRQQFIVVIVLDFAIAVGLVAMIASLVACDGDSGKNRPEMSDEAAAKRLQPVGTVVLAEPGATTAPVAPAPAPAAAPTPAAAPAPAATAPAESSTGKAVYDKACAVCHAAGVAGAPKAGDKAAWASRLKTGMDPLYVTALKGKGAMPPKGGNVALPDADVKAAVDYMVSLVK